MSFLSYNDISAMSRLHRSASAQMSRIAISIHKSGGWTFGSPSVLMMFHRAPGKMQSELADMDECMPHYYKITDGHGQGAEKIMRAEAAFAQGRFTDAHIELESAYARIEGNGQENMALCCDFLAWRLSLCTDVEMRYSFEQRREQLLRQHNAAWLNILDAASAYYHALLGKTERIPEVFSAHRLSLISILAPGKPMAEMIENQVLLAQGAYAKVIGRSEGQLAVCEAMHYALVALHVRLQTAAAYEALGKRAEACRLLDQALKDAAPDWIMIPFVENYAYIKPTLQYCSGQPELIGSIVRLGEAMLARKKPRRTQALAGRVCRADRSRIRDRVSHAQAAEQPRDRRKAVSVRGQRQAIYEADILKARHTGRYENKKKAAFGAYAAKLLTFGEWLFFIVRRTIAVRWTFFAFLSRKEDWHLTRKYISAVTPLKDNVLQVDFVTGSRLLLDMSRYLDKLRFRPLANPEVWNSAVTNGIFIRFGNVELSHDEILSMAEQ